MHEILWWYNNLTKEKKKSRNSRVSNWRQLFRRPLFVIRWDDHFELLAVRELWSPLHYFVEALSDEWCGQGFDREPSFGFRELDSARSLRVRWNRSLTQGILPDKESSESIGVILSSRLVTGIWCCNQGIRGSKGKDPASSLGTSPRLVRVRCHVGKCSR